MTHIFRSPGSDVTQGAFFFFTKCRAIQSENKPWRCVGLHSESMLFWESQPDLAVCKQVTEAKQVQGYKTTRFIAVNMEPRVLYERFGDEDGGR
jgi:hypothetical protein